MTAADFEFDFLAVFKLCVAVALNFRVVDEKIFAAVVGLDETVAFLGVEPLYCSCAHSITLY